MTVETIGSEKTFISWATELIFSNVLMVKVFSVMITSLNVNKIITIFLTLQNLDHF
jgi:hypothetical protein